LSMDRVMPALEAKGKRDVISELVGALPLSKVDPERLVQTLMERERLGSTGIGDGVAIPHGKLEEIGQLIAAFGRSSKGVDFDSLDGKPTHLFFLLVAPENSAGNHLKVLARISRLFKDGQFRHALMAARDRENLYRIIREADEKFG